MNDALFEHLFTPRPFLEWNEDRGDVLWWKYPVESAPYCGVPLDLGHTVEIDISVATSQRSREQPGDTKIRTLVGGWPFTEEDEPWLFWTPLPDGNVIHDRIADHIRGGHSPFLIIDEEDDDLCWLKRTSHDIANALHPYTEDNMVYGWRSKDGAEYRGKGYPVHWSQFHLDNENAVAFLVKFGG